MYHNKCDAIGQCEQSSKNREAKENMEESLSQRIKRVILTIPKGKVATYGQIAALAGNPSAARQVAWVLHASSRKANLPWQRVINSKGGISLARGNGYELQKALLEQEDVVFDDGDRIDLKRYLWNPGKQVT